MKHFIALVHKDADSAFGVSFPDLQGCFSAADYDQDILPNASEALALFFDDQDVDQLVTTCDLTALAVRFASEFHGGAFLLSVPYFETSSTSVKKAISLDAGTLKAINKAAQARGKTRSNE